MTAIKLNTQEQELYNNILSMREIDPYEDLISKFEDSNTLMTLLLKRDAIPEQRLLYYVDKKYQTKRTKLSKLEELSSNEDEEGFTNSHFRKYLIYFVSGAHIEPILDKKTREIVAQNFYPEDAINEIFFFLKGYGRIPKSKHERNQFAEEMFKFAIDLKFRRTHCFHLYHKIKG